MKKRTDLIFDLPLEEGFKCSFCQEPSVGGPMNGVVSEEGKEVCCCPSHFFQVRSQWRFKTRRLEKEKKRQERR